MTDRDRSGGGKPRPYTNQITVMTPAAVAASVVNVGAALAAARGGDGCADATAGGDRSGGGKPRPYNSKTNEPQRG